MVKVVGRGCECCVWWLLPRAMTRAWLGHGGLVVASACMCARGALWIHMRAKVRKRELWMKLVKQESDILTRVDIMRG